MVLQDVPKLFRKTSEIDAAARYGNEEFIVLRQTQKEDGCIWRRE
jgi:PleD family two-component response regulator